MRDALDNGRTMEMFPAIGFDQLESLVAAANATVTKESALNDEPDGKEWPGLLQTEEEFAKETIDYASMNESDCDEFDEFGAALIDKIIEAKTQQTQAQFTDPLPHVPVELKTKTNWVRWKLELVEGRWTKVPYQLSGSKASSTNSATWNTYEAVVTGAVLSQSEGIGIMCDGTFVGFDMDGCRNPATGEIAPWAQRIIDTLGAYTEITPSGYGVRVYAFGQLPDGARRFSLALSAGFGDKVGIEAYHENRYFTVTGNRVGSASVMFGQVLEAYELCHPISRAFPSEKRNQAAQFNGSDSSSSVVFTRKPGSLASKLSVLMYGKIVSRSPFVVENEHGDQVTAPSQSEADMSLATLLAMEHGDNPELIDQDFCESALYRPKWEPSNHKTYAEATIAKAIKSAEKNRQNPVVEPPAAATTPPAQAQVQADAAAKASEGAEGTFPTPEGVFSKPTDAIPPFDDSMLVGVIRKLTDALCAGTTIPRQYGSHAAKAMLSAIMTTYKIPLDGCESARTYFITFGATGTGKGTIFRRMTEILKCWAGRPFVSVTESIDSEAGMRDAFFEIPENQNHPFLYFVDEVRTLGEKADGKKNPEIIGGIIEMANKTVVSRTKAKRGKEKATKTRHDCWLLLYACTQDGEAFATAFPRTKKQGLSDRFLPEYSDAVESGKSPVPNLTMGLEALAEAIAIAEKVKGGMSQSQEASIQFETIWQMQPEELRKSPRLRQQFLLEVYFQAFARGSAVVEAQDLAVATRLFERQKVIRRVFFSEEIPNQVGVYIHRLRKISEEMLRALRKGKHLAEVALSFRDLATQCLAYKDNDLDTFKRAWDAMIPFFVEITVKSPANGHEYEKVVPMPDEIDTWLPAAYKLIHPKKNW